MRSHDLKVLVAVELGSPWPAWVADLLRGLPRRVCSQGDAESPATFVDRVSSVAKAEVGRSLCTLVLLCNERTDLAQQAARRTLLEALLEKLSRSRTDRVVLGARGGSPRVHDTLDALVKETSTFSPMTLEIRFDEADEPSGLNFHRDQAMAHVA